MTEPRIALVYDWATTPYGGAEQVLLALHEVFPEAPLFTSIYDTQRAQWAGTFKVKTTFLQHFPLAKRYFRAYGPLMPLAFETLDLSPYEIIISVTSSFAKSVRTHPHQRHICYLLTPNRHLYTHQNHYQPQVSFPLNYLFTQLLKYLRTHDQAAAQRPDVVIPISELVARRAKNFYQRELHPVIYPPVNVISIQPIKKTKGDYYLVVSRLVAYKRIDLAIKACQELGRQLVIVGDGPELPRLTQLASNNVVFKGKVSQVELERMYQGAAGLLMPGLEDFGITALEAAAYGVPVILHRDSGAAEILREGKEAVHLQNSSLEELTKAMHTLEMTAWDPVIMNKQVQKYSKEHFQKKFKGVIL